MSAPGQDPFDPSLPREHDPQALSEARLRQLYEEEEVERFVSFFSAYVTEFRLVAGTESHIIDGRDTATGRGTLIGPSNDHALSEYIAYNYLLPYLPPATSVPPAFTLKRLGLTVQRLYLALFPVYRTFLLDLARLALWNDYQRSLRYCIMFWFLWFHDLLLPALVFRIAFGLLRRRLSTHPTIKELQERRQETAQALRFWEAVQQRLSVSTLGPIEMWRLFRLYKSGEKVTSIRSVETDEEESLRRDALRIMNELADLLERVKNIFTWRRPDVSYRYLFFFIVAGLGTLVLPAQYIAKVVYWLGGMLFWHVAPVIAALPQADRTRVSLLLTDAPTDADYAMELIARRVATGQDIGKASLRDQPYRTPNGPASTETLASTLYGAPREAQLSEDDRINWKKWSERVARGKSFVEEGRRFLSSHTPRNQNSAETAAVAVNVSRTGEAHSFLAQYASSPGLITLTPSTLIFTSLIRSHAKLVVPLDRLRGVKRSGLVKGLCITWAPEEPMGGEEREERFQWVGDRDELFARLVGTDGGRWIRV